MTDRPHILPLIDSAGDRAVFVRWLREAGEYEVLDPADIDLHDHRIDLCVLDRQALWEHIEVLRERKRKHGDYVPYLLIVPESTADAGDNAIPGNEELIDDVVRTPLRPMALSKRLTVLLQFREQTNQLQTTNQRLRIINRVARHDIRNDMSVVLGWAEELRGHVDEAGEPMLEHIIDGSQNVISLTTALRDVIETIDEEEPTLEPVSLFETLLAEFQRMRRMNEQATLRLAVPEAELTIDPSDPITDAAGAPDVDVRANELLSSVFRNVIENAIEHNRDVNPQVWVSVEIGSSNVTVHIADDGPGIPENQREAVRGRAPEGLNHPAAGLGLYLVDTLVHDYGGSLSITDSEYGGTTVTITLERVNHDGT